MRCPRCGRKARRLRTDRGPDGRLLFHWCLDCLADIHSEALRGITRKTEPVATRPASSRETRPVGMRTIGVSLFLWGLMLEIAAAGLWLGYGPPDAGFGLSRWSRLRLFSVSGGILGVAGTWVALASVDRAARRQSLARAIEAMALALGLGALILGIAFHEAKRDPLVIATVALACVAIWAVRQWGHRKDFRTRTVSPRSQRP